MPQQKAFSKAYDDVIPKLKLDTTDGSWLEVANLRGMVQSLPEREAQAFDSVIAQEIDGRIAPNGVLSGQNLKTLWQRFATKARSSPLARCLSVGFGSGVQSSFIKELLDEMMAKNGALGQQLKKG